ncbi:MAG: hypothetical protein MPJ25_01650 [Pirellulales bacterium]|nr:hypothetical protein [Pirellulales bacterium]
MTFLRKQFDPFYGHPFNGLLDNFFHTPTFSRRITIDQKILADKSNYSIWELPDGQHEVRVQYSDDETLYHKASVKKTLEDAEKYVDEQVGYHARKLEGPKLVKSYKD